MKRFFVVVFSLLSFSVVALYLLSCLTPYLSPSKFWPLTFLSLGFPLLACCMLLVMFVWLLTHKKTGLLFLVLFCFGLQNITSVFAFRFPSTFKFDKDTLTLRVLDWNVKHFTDNRIASDHPRSIRRVMMNFIKSTNADVMLMQEFEEHDGPDSYSNIKFLRDTLGFKYYHFSKDIVAPKTNEGPTVRSAIFSKLPLTNLQRFPLSQAETDESIALADVTFRGKKIRLATFHLISLELGQPPNNSEFFGRVDGDFLLHASRIQKIKYFDNVHASQAKVISNILSKSPYPLIISGDFNAVPGSYAYYLIKGNMQDAFLKKGSGFGRTFTGLSPTLRIDYLFADEQLKINQYTSPRLYLSDHFPVLTDLTWRKPNP